MQSLSDFLRTLGDLHDCKITELTWSIRSKSVEMYFDDLMVNFEGLPEYHGPVAGSVSLTGVQHVFFDLDWSEKTLRVMEFSCEKIDKEFQKASVLFSPSGKLQVVFSGANFPGDLTS